ncbi:hypothetical protein WA158_002001 [Blastocystis sp. Blastoise]
MTGIIILNCHMMILSKENYLLKCKFILYFVFRYLIYLLLISYSIKNIYSYCLLLSRVDDSCNSKDTFTLQKDSNGGVERHNEVHTVSFMDSDKDSSQESENTLRQRHTTENGIKSEIIENNKTISATNISHIKKTLKDPLYMFSILPPHSLRSAQLQFNLVIPKCVKIANIKTKLNSLINKYENLKLEIIDN